MHAAGGAERGAACWWGEITPNDGVTAALLSSAHREPWKRAAHAGCFHMADNEPWGGGGGEWVGPVGLLLSSPSALSSTELKRHRVMDPNLFFFLDLFYDFILHLYLLIENDLVAKRSFAL